jgi:hypothetical protein
MVNFSFSMFNVESLSEDLRPESTLVLVDSFAYFLLCKEYRNLEIMKNQGASRKMLEIQQLDMPHGC